MLWRSTNKTIIWCNGTNHFSSFGLHHNCKAHRLVKTDTGAEEPAGKHSSSSALHVLRPTVQTVQTEFTTWRWKNKKTTAGERKRREHLARCCEMCDCVFEKRSCGLRCIVAGQCCGLSHGVAVCHAEQPGILGATINAAVSSCSNGPGTRPGMKDTQ